MKHYIVFENGEYHKIGASGFTPPNMVCECSASDDLDVMDIVDNIDELTGEVLGKKLQFNEVKYEAKRAQLADQEAQRLAEIQRQADLAYLASTDWYVVRFVETGVAIPSEITQLRAQARLRL